MTYELPRPTTRILWSVVALLFLVGVIPLGLFGVRLTRFNRERLEDEQKVHQLMIAEAIALEIGEFVEARQATIGGFARGLETALLVSESPLGTLSAVRDRRLLNRVLEQDPDLFKIVYATRPTAPGTDPRRLEFVSAARDEDLGLTAPADELLVGTLLEAALAGRDAAGVPEGDKPSLVVAIPVRRGEAVESVLAAVIDLAGLQERLDQRSQQLYVVFMTDRQGRRLLAHSKRSPGHEALQTDLVRAFREGDGTPRTMPYKSGAKEMLGAFAAVPGTGWGVMVEIDADSAFYAVQRMRETTIVWSVAAVLLALVLGTLFAGHLVRPIRALADGALRLARGDFSAPIRLKSKNELGLLAESFNHMAGEIKDQMDRLEAAARENKELFFDSIRMLAEAIDEKDPYTRGHSERVSRFSVATARAMGFTDGEVEKVQISALLHDVGKIGIDDRILRKPTVLTDEEFEVMKQHPDKGAHIMGAVRQLADIIPGMRFHHEKYDGTGYPLGLKGDEIPVVAQIISVADTFDAMTTDRPYQKGMDPEFVIGKLKSWVGTRYRPDVIDGFEHAFRAGAVEVKAKKAPMKPVPVARG